jgi:hypothetical protein
MREGGVSLIRCSPVIRIATRKEATNSLGCDSSIGIVPVVVLFASGRAWVYYVTI